jgi:hypothetical protein
MGVEYSHGLFVLDLQFQPTWDHVVAVGDVLKAWKLAGKDLYDLTDGVEPIDRTAAKRALPANLMADYGELDGKAVVALVGDSQYEIEPASRYIQSAIGIFGVDFKLMVNETFEVEMTSPPKDGKTAIEDYDDSSIADHWSYRASWTTTPPKTKVLQGSASERAFGGVWRTGIILDCGKDLPSISEAGAPLPAKGFRTALEKALGTKLVEVGWYH